MFRQGKMVKMLVFLVLAAVLLFADGAQAATTWTVCQEGGCNYSSIRAAIEASSTVDEDTVLVSGGTYLENIDFLSKAITVRSKYGTKNTTIDGNYSGSVVSFVSGEGLDSVLEGFTITHGWVIGSGGAGGAIHCSFSSPTITNCLIFNNDADYGGGIGCISSAPIISNCIVYYNGAFNGGGISCRDNSSPTIINCTINGNVADNGGGIFCALLSSPNITNCYISGNGAYSGSGIACFSSSPTITDCTIYGNAEEFSSGGGIYCYLSSPIINRCTISSNSANSGGGIYCDSSSPIIKNCVISDHQSDFGGGIACNNSNPAITGCTISNNEGEYGGGIACYESSPTITNCTISNNRHDFDWTDGEDGSGINCVYSSNPKITNCTITGNEGSGIFCYYASPVVTNCTISGNGDNADFGGGIACYGASPVISRCNISGNSAQVKSYGGGGGGIYGYSSSLTVINSIIAGNTIFPDSYYQSKGGGGILGEANSYLAIKHCTIGDNDAVNQGGGIACYSSSTFEMINSILWGDTADGNPNEVYNEGNVFISYSDVENGWSGQGNKNADPLFVGGGNYHLKYGSPCIDTATRDVVPANNLVDDIDGNPRPLDGNGSGTAEYDMGADEYKPLTPIISVKGDGYYTTLYSGVGYRTQVSIKLCSEVLPQGTLGYYNSKSRVTFACTAIQSVNFPSAKIAVVTGKGAVNKKAGYSFKATITDSSNKWEMIIYNSSGGVYESTSGCLNSGDLLVKVSEACGF